MTRETKVLFPYGISFSGDKSIPKLREYFEKSAKRPAVWAILSASFALALILTVVPKHAQAQELVKTTSRLEGHAAVRVEVHVTQRAVEAEHAAVSVNHIHELGVRGHQVTPTISHHVQRERRVKPWARKLFNT